MTTDLQLDGFLDDYFAECDEHLSEARQHLLALEASLSSPGSERAAVDGLFRNFHSIKGISGMVELREAEQLAHEMESYLRAIRQSELRLTAEGVDALIDGAQRLEEVVGARSREAAIPPIADLLSRLAALVPAARTKSAAGLEHTPRAVVAGGQSFRVTFRPSRERADQSIGVDLIRRRIAEHGTILETVPGVNDDGSIEFVFIVTTTDVVGLESLRQLHASVERVEEKEAEALEAVAPTPDQAPALARNERASSSHYVRVELRRLDELMRSVGDLVISRARLSDSLTRAEAQVPASQWRAIQENAGTIDRQLRTLREGIMRVRLVPIGEIFNRMPLVVRDLARSFGRQVELRLDGQGTEIDKYLIERMMDPVLHLVRNAIAHGIETPEERIAAGKTPQGTIHLSAATVGDRVTIDIADDGCGIDVERVLQSAKAAGVPVPPGPPTGAALLALVCAPGLSTRLESDRAAGRGVGMAVVKAAVEQLSGSLALETVKGQGTRFTVHLPITLAITDAIILHVGPQTFAVPQGAVQEVLEVDPSAVRTVEQHELVPHRQGALPLLRLARLFGIDAAPRDRLHVFVAGQDSAAVGFAVDRIVGQREIVVRPIVDPLVRVEGVSGATDLGDGRAVLILDPAALSRMARRQAADARPIHTAPARSVRGPMGITEQQTSTFIIFDVAGTAYALPSDDVQHMEMVEGVTRVPNAPAHVDGVVFSRGQVVPAVNLRARFGCERVPYGLRSRLIVVQADGRTVGLIVDQAREFVRIGPAAIQPPQDAIGGTDNDYVTGIASLDGRLIVILNLERLMAAGESVPNGLSRRRNMAVRTVKGNGRTNGKAAPRAGAGLQNAASEFTLSATALARVADEFTNGAREQTRSLDEALSGVNEMSASLKETSTQGASAASSVEQLVNSITEMSASIEQVTANVRSLAGSAAVSSGAMLATSTSIQSVASSMNEMTASSQQVATSITQSSAATRTISRDTEELTGAVNETAAAIEEISRSIDGVAGHANDLAAAAEQTSSSINEMAASIEEVGAMAENLATSADQNSISVEQMNRSVQMVAASGRSITDLAASSASSAAQMERSTASVASLARQADEVTRRASSQAEEGGATVQRSIQGIGRLRDSMTQSASVIREMGRRTSEISSIVDTINLIAERTNLLSLNASIEAARAGDAGRGFAVVAEEIRNLADRSAKATADIGSIIKALQEVAHDAVTAANDGLRVADESNSLAENGAIGLKKILGSLDDVTGVVAQIARAADEQRGAAQTVVTAVNATADQARVVANATAEQASAASGMVQATSQIRKVSQEVSKAVNEQGRAARDIMKAAQAASRLAGQVRKASLEQAKSAAQIAQTADSMRRGVVSTSRALVEQASTGDQLAKAAEAFTRQTGAVTRAIGEHTAAATQVTSDVDNIRRQAEQAGLALADQARAMKELTGASQNTSKQIKLISGANREHATVSASLLAQLKEIRQVTDQNVRTATESRGAAAMLERQAAALTNSAKAGVGATRSPSARQRAGNGHR